MMAFAPPRAAPRPTNWIGRPVLQRRCACEGRCADCRGRAPPSVARALAGPGRPLDPALRGGMQRRLGIDLSQVRVHTDSTAAASAREVAAEAYTVGRDIVFAEGRYRPQQPDGQALLAHELTHVAQQGGAVAVPGQPIPIRPATDAAEQEAAAVAPKPLGGIALQRKPEVLGTVVTDPKGTKSPFKAVTAHFDGANFTVQGDGKPVLSAAAQSGRPYTVRPADAKACGGKADDSYMNNPRYVGIADNGPIPEGEYTFNRGQMVTFTGLEQARMSLASPGTFVDPRGSDVHGDWGAARAPLHPVKLVAAKHCGNTGTRSGFYLHGGSMPGSSGCIDIGNSAITSMVAKLAGFTAPVKLTVKYTAPVPDVGFLDRAAGRFMYPGKKTGTWDRLKSLAGYGDNE